MQHKSWTERMGRQGLSFPLSAFPKQVRRSGCLFVCNQLYYPATCQPKGHGSSEPRLLHDFSPNPIPDQRHPKQATGCHAVPVGFLLPVLPGLLGRETEGKGKEKEHSVRPAPGLTAPPSPQPCLTRIRTPIPPPSRPPSSRGSPRRCRPVSRAPLRPALYVVVKATSTPSLRPRGPLVGVPLFKCGWGVLKSVIIRLNVLRIVGREAAFWGVKPIPLLFPPSWESWSTGRPWGCRYRSTMAQPPIRLRTLSLLFFGLLAQTVTLSLVVRCELWPARVAARRLPGAAGARPQMQPVNVIGCPRRYLAHVALLWPVELDGQRVESHAASRKETNTRFFSCGCTRRSPSSMDRRRTRAGTGQGPPPASLERVLPDELPGSVKPLDLGKENRVLGRRLQLKVEHLGK